MLVMEKMDNPLINLIINAAAAYLKVHVQEARNDSATKSEDLAYSKSSTVNGLINSFVKSMSYQSCFNLI